MAKTETLMLWTTMVEDDSPGEATVKAVQPMLGQTCDTAKAMKIVGTKSKWLIYKLYKQGLIKGIKPGDTGTRGDKQWASNAKIEWCVESCYAYRKALEATQQAYWGW